MQKRDYVVIPNDDPFWDDAPDLIFNSDTLGAATKKDYLLENLTEGQLDTPWTSITELNCQGAQSTRMMHVRSKLHQGICCHT